MIDEILRLSLFLLSDPVTLPIVLVAGVAGVLSARFSGTTRKENRHRMYRKSANKVSKWAISAQRKEIIPRLQKVHSIVFEEFTLNCFEKMGATVYRNWKYSGDGGVDGRIKYKGQFYLIQCKRYSTAIKRQHLIEFESLCESRRCRGFFIHTSQSQITPTSNRVQIISGNDLINLAKGTEIHF